MEDLVKFKGILFSLLAFVLILLSPNMALAQDMDQTTDIQVESQVEQEQDESSDQAISPESQDSEIQEDDSLVSENERLNQIGSEDDVDSQSDDVQDDVDNSQDLDLEENEDSLDLFAEDNVNDQGDEAQNENVSPVENNEEEEVDTPQETAPEENLESQSLIEYQAQSAENDLDNQIDEVQEDEASLEENSQEESLEDPEDIIDEEEESAEETLTEDEEEFEGIDDQDPSNKFEVSVISDNHILPTEMIGLNDYYNTAVQSDRKLFTESVGLLEKAIELIENKGSQYIFLPGDLTKDGEYLAHEKMAQVLENWKNNGVNREVFLVPGNHDINCTNAYDYSSGQAVPAKRTNHEDFVEIYGNLVYKNNYILGLYKDSDYYKNYLNKVNSEIEREEEYKPYAHGYTSYVARVNGNEQDVNGMTVIGLDTTINTADTTSTGEDDHHETGGKLRAPLMSWLLDQVEAANSRNDLVAILAHHAFLPHFKNQDKVLSPYIIEQWDTPYESNDERINGKTPKEILANNNVRYLFTGHLHANDIAEYTDSNTGQKFYDIQTGATLTYPLPVRHITFENNIDTDNPHTKADIETEFIQSFTYTNPETEEEIHIADAQAYAGTNQLTPELVANMGAKFIDSKLDLDNLDILDTVLGLAEIDREGYGNQLLVALSKLLPEDTIEAGSAKIDTSYEETESENKINVDASVKVLFFPVTAKMKITGQGLEESVDILAAQANDLISKENIRGWIHDLVESMVSMEIYNDGETVKTVLDLANDSYKSYLRGDENQADYITTFLEEQRNPETKRDLVVDMVNHASDTINGIFNNILESIEYKTDLEGEADSTGFAKKLLQNDGSGNIVYGKAADYVADSVLGKNLRETIQDKMLASKLAEMIKGDDYQEGDTIQGIDLANMALQSETVQSLTGQLAQYLGGQNLNQLVVDLVDAMTAEIVPGYEYAYLPDSSTVLELEAQRADLLDEEKPTIEDDEEQEDPVIEDDEEEEEPVIEDDEEQEDLVVEDDEDEEEPIVEDDEEQEEPIVEDEEEIEEPIIEDDEEEEEPVIEDDEEIEDPVIEDDEEQEEPIVEDGEEIEEPIIEDDEEEEEPVIEDDEEIEDPVTEDDEEQEEPIVEDEEEIEEPIIEDDEEEEEEPVIEDDEEIEDPVIEDDEEQEEPIVVDDEDQDVEIIIISPEDSYDDQSDDYSSDLMDVRMTYLEDESSIQIKIRNGQANKSFSLYLGDLKIADISLDELGNLDLIIKLSQDIKSGQYQLKLIDNQGQVISSIAITITDSQAA